MRGKLFKWVWFYLHFFYIVLFLTLKYSSFYLISGEGFFIVVLILEVFSTFLMEGILCLWLISFFLMVSVILLVLLINFLTNWWMDLISFLLLLVVKQIFGNCFCVVVKRVQWGFLLHLFFSKFLFFFILFSLFLNYEGIGVLGYVFSIRGFSYLVILIWAFCFFFLLYLLVKKRIGNFLVSYLFYSQFMLIFSIGIGLKYFYMCVIIDLVFFILIFYSYIFFSNGLEEIFFSLGDWSYLFLFLGYSYFLSVPPFPSFFLELSFYGWVSLVFSFSGILFLLCFIFLSLLNYISLLSIIFLRMCLVFRGRSEGIVVFYFLDLSVWFIALGFYTILWYFFLFKGVGLYLFLVNEDFGFLVYFYGSWLWFNSICLCLSFLEFLSFGNNIILVCVILICLWNFIGNYRFWSFMFFSEGSLGCGFVLYYFFKFKKCFIIGFLISGFFYESFSVIFPLIGIVVSLSLNFLMLSVGGYLVGGEGFILEYLGVGEQWKWLFMGICLFQIKERFLFFCLESFLIYGFSLEVIVLFKKVCKEVEMKGVVDISFKLFLCSSLLYFVKIKDLFFIGEDFVNCFLLCGVLDLFMEERGRVSFIRNMRNFSGNIVFLSFDGFYIFYFTSIDVIHSFGVSYFGIKMDSIPGFFCGLVVEFFKLRSKGLDIEFSCYELCGVGHSYMIGRLVLSSVEFLYFFILED